jgi:hypothetical protein
MEGFRIYDTNNKSVSVADKVSGEGAVNQIALWSAVGKVLEGDANFAWTDSFLTLQDADANIVIGDGDNTISIGTGCINIGNGGTASNGGIKIGSGGSAADNGIVLGNGSTAVVNAMSIGDGVANTTTGSIMISNTYTTLIPEVSGALHLGSRALTKEMGNIVVGGIIDFNEKTVGLGVASALAASVVNATEHTGWLEIKINGTVAYLPVWD